MIIKYNLKDFFRDRRINLSSIAKEIGISKQLLNYQLNKGDLPLSSITIIEDYLKFKRGYLYKTLNEAYVRIKI